MRTYKGMYVKIIGDRSIVQSDPQSDHFLGRVCFGVHELSHRVPKEAPKRKDFMSIINSFITYVNHQNKYPTKIGHIDI